MDKTRLFERLPDEQRPKKPPKKKKTPPSLVPGLIVLSFFILAVTILLIVFLSHLGLLNLPFGAEGATNTADTGFRFSDELLSRLPPSSGEESGGVSLEITLEDLKNIVAGSDKTTDYVQTLKITYLSTVKRVYTAHVVTKDGRFRADLVSDGNIILKRIVYDTARIQLFDGATGLSKVFSLNDWFTLGKHENYEVLSVIYGFSPRSEVGLPSASDMLTLLESEDVSDYKVELVRDAEENYIRVSFVYDLTGVSETYEMDLETGIILRARSCLDGQEYYTAETESLTFDLSEYTASYFTIQ